MEVLISFAAGIAVMLVSLSGILFTSQRMSAWINARLHYLATFSAGVLSVLAYHLIEEAFTESDKTALVAACVVAGMIALELIHRIIPDSHHHHGETDHTHTDVDGRRVLISDSIHNITDGFLIVSAFMADWRIGVGATVGIMLHECVQEISEFFVLKHAGYSNRNALFYNFISSSTVLVGVALALVLSSSESILTALTALAAGGFLSVVMRDLIPSAVESAKSTGKWLPHATAILLGAGLMFALSLAVPHEDEHGTHDMVHEPQLAVTR